MDKYRIIGDHVLNIGKQVTEMKIGLVHVSCHHLCVYTVCRRTFFDRLS